MFKILDEVCTPTRGSKYSACVDLYSKKDVTIGAGETVKIPLGVCIDLSKIENKLVIEEEIIHDELFDNIPEKIFDYQDYEEFLKSHYLLLEPRSSLRAKGLIVGSGIIDLDYKDEIKMIIHNPIKSSEILNYIRLAQNLNEESQINTDFEIKKGDKIAQITLLEHKSYLFGIDTDEERKGGFGSTGSK